MPRWSPGWRASEAIRATARSLGLDPAHGVTVRLTGPVPLADEEFATLAQDADLLLGAMFAALLGILWLAVRSARVVIAILATTLVGLVITAAIGLLATTRFNLISVAFIPLFVGLGVDFSIQFSVRSLAERLVQPNLEAALTATGTAIGRALALSAAAIGAGFFAFLPTSYVGVAELGTIAGLGMIVAFVLSVVLLPALLILLRPPTGRHGRGRLHHAGAGRCLRACGIAAGVLAAALVAAIVVMRACCRWCVSTSTRSNLRSSKVESMATLHALASDPDWTPDAINILAPSLAASEPLVRRLDALPEVSRTVTLNSFVPGQQKEKLALIGNAAMLLKPILDVRSARAALRPGAAAQPGDDGSFAATSGGQARRIPPPLRRVALPMCWSVCSRPRRRSAPRPLPPWSARSGSCSIRPARCCRPGR